MHRFIDSQLINRLIPLTHRLLDRFIIPVRILNWLLLLVHRLLNRLMHPIRQLISILGESSIDSLYGHIDSLINSFETHQLLKIPIPLRNQFLPDDPSTPQSTPQTHSSTQLPNMRTRTLIRVPVWILTQLLFTHRLLTWLIRLHSTHHYTLIDSSDSRVRLLTHRFMNRLIQLLNQLMSVLLVKRIRRLNSPTCALEPSSVYQFESSLNSFYLHIDSLLDSFNSWINSWVYYSHHHQSTRSTDTCTTHSTPESTHECTIRIISRLVLPTHALLNQLIRHMNQLISPHMRTSINLLQWHIDTCIDSSMYTFDSWIDSSRTHQLLITLLKIPIPLRNQFLPDDPSTPQSTHQTHSSTQLPPSWWGCPGPGRTPYGT